MLAVLVELRPLAKQLIALCFTLEPRSCSVAQTSDSLLRRRRSVVWICCGLRDIFRALLALPDRGAAIDLIARFGINRPIAMAIQRLPSHTNLLITP